MGAGACACVRVQACARRATSAHACTRAWPTTWCMRVVRARVCVCVCVCVLCACVSVDPCARVRACTHARTHARTRTRVGTRGPCLAVTLSAAPPSPHQPQPCWPLLPGRRPLETAQILPSAPRRPPARHRHARATHTPTHAFARPQAMHEQKMVLHTGECSLEGLMGCLHKPHARCRHAHRCGSAHPRDALPSQADTVLRHAIALGARLACARTHAHLHAHARTHARAQSA